MHPRHVAALALLLAAPLHGAPQPGSPDVGRALFTGERAFQNRGAPCGACHALGGEGLAFTASLGPELSAGLSGMDAEMLDGILESLPFPSMAPLYDKRALTPAERADLAAYLMPAVLKGPPKPDRRFELFGALGAALLVGGTFLAARGRKTSSRARLIEKAYGAKGGGR